MNNFKIGDKVRLKKDVEPYKSYNGCIITDPEFINYFKKTRKVTDVDNEFNILTVNHRISSPFEVLEVVEEEEEMTGFEVLLKHWGIEVGEKFNIKEGGYNPYHFDKDGDLYNRDYDICNDVWRWDIVTGRAEIEKIKVKEMTIADIEKELGYSIKIIKEKR